MHSLHMQAPQQNQQGPFPQQEQHQPLSHSQTQAPNPPTNSSLTNNTTKSNSSQPKEKRRWSLTCHFFDKRKNTTQSSSYIPGGSTSNNAYLSLPPTISLQQQRRHQLLQQLPQSPPQQIQPPPPPPPQQQQQLTNNTKYANEIYCDIQLKEQQGLSSVGSRGGGSSSGSGHSSGSSGHRRSSLVDIPKALFSTFRRGPPSSSASTRESVSVGSQQQQPSQYEPSQQKEGDDSLDTDYEEDSNSSIPPDMEDDDQEDMVIIQEESNFVTETIIFLTAGGPMLATMAVLKAPLSPPLPIKGILKKHPPTGTLGQSSRVRPNSHNRLVHPIARDDIQMSGMLSATDHRARLETSSPIPSHFARQQHHQHMTPAPKWMSGYPNKLFHSSGYGAYNEKTLSNSPMMSSKLDLPIKLDNLPFLQGGGALPPDFMPGVQSNIYQNHGGESSQGQGADYQMNMNPSTLYHDAPPLPATIAVSAAYVYQHQYSRVSSNQIYGGYSNNNGHDLNSSTVQDPYGYASYSYRTGSWNDVSGSMRMMHIGNGRYRSSSVVLNGNGINHRPRTIGFTDKIEIIPAYRKSEYNRQSDKYATFKNLTPDLKCEIRDELNTYKMREMAVHIESMGNTAFH